MKKYEYGCSHQMCSVRKGVLRNFAKFTGKQLRPATLSKKRFWNMCFPANFVKFLRTPSLQTTSERLLLPILFSHLSQSSLSCCQDSAGGKNWLLTLHF